MTVTPTAEIEQLWNEHHATLSSYIKRHTREEAEDVVQDVYLSALEAMRRGLGYQEHAKGWLYRIARNRMIDGYRRIAHQPRHIDIDDLADSDDESHGRARAEVLVCDQPLPEAIAEQADLVATIEAAVSTLPDNQRSVVRMRLDGYDNEGIARAIGKGSGATKQLQCRAFDRLHVVLAKRFGYAKTTRDVPQSNCAEQVRELLLAKGPMTATQVEHALRFGKGSIAYALRFSGHFVVIGYRTMARRPANIWGIKGIHEPKEGNNG